MLTSRPRSWIPRAANRFPRRTLQHRTPHREDRAGLARWVAPLLPSEIVRKSTKPCPACDLDRYDYLSAQEGSYLTACVLYSTLFQEDLAGIDYYAALPEDEATYFQSVASDIVLNDLELWNIVP